MYTLTCRRPCVQKGRMLCSLRKHAHVARVCQSGLRESGEVFQVRVQMKQGNEECRPEDGIIDTVAADVVILPTRAGMIPRRRLEERLAQFNNGEVTLVESSFEHARTRRLQEKCTACVGVFSGRSR